ncbi:MAG: MarR family winged helix-turn-helix transcriptional regulator [Burkholderiaceae bacterium]
MTQKFDEIPTAPTPGLAPSPWDGLDDAGTGLTVDNFLTTRMSQTINLLRRSVTLPYAKEAGLTVSEWRILSLVAHAGQIAFAELVVQSSSDKALVSRTVRLLEQRSLIRTESAGNTPRKRMTVFITAQGDALHVRVIPLARQRQAEMILVMSPDERRGMFHGLRKLTQRCVEAGSTDDDAADGNDA